MRRNPTVTEALLWRALSAQKLGVPFKRQVVLGDFIVDFAAPRLKLVVEVDGGYHSERMWLDAARQRKLERAGYVILRFTDEQVLTEYRAVVETIVNAVQRLAR